MACTWQRLPFPRLSSRWHVAPYPLPLMAIGGGFATVVMLPSYLLGLYGSWIAGMLATWFTTAAYQYEWSCGDLSGFGAQFVIMCCMFPRLAWIQVFLLWISLCGTAAHAVSSIDGDPHMEKLTLWTSFQDFFSVGAFRRLFELQNYITVVSEPAFI